MNDSLMPIFSGSLSLLERSLRLDARFIGSHLIRFGLILTIYINLIYALHRSGWVGAAGQELIWNVAYLNVLFLTILGISYFSTAITEEKEENTLGLMVLAGVTPLGILAGKFGGRLIQAFLLIAIQYPFTALAPALGGVTPSQIRAMYAAIYSYAFMLAGVGLLCSTVAERNRSAAIRLTVFVIAHAIASWFCHSLVAGRKAAGMSESWILQRIADSSVWIQAIRIQSVNYPEIWTNQVVSNLAIGCAGFLLSWAAFRRLASQSIQNANRFDLTNVGRASRLFSPGRVWQRPWLWKEYYYTAGGPVSIGLRILIYAALYYLSPIGVCAQVGNRATDRMVTVFYLELVSITMAIDAAFLISKSLQDEAKENTLPLLSLLPGGATEIVYRKVFGSLIGWLPGPLFFLGGTAWLPDAPGLSWHLLFVPVRLVLPSQYDGMLVLACLLLIPHTAAVYSLFLRWGALSLAIGTTVAIAFVIGLIMVATSQRDQDLADLCARIVILTLCAVCHYLLLQRVKELSTNS